VQNDYIAALERDGIDTLLAPDRVAADTGFRDSRATLAKVRRTVGDFRKRAMAIIEKMPERLAEYKFNKHTRSGFMAGYRDSMEKTLPLMRETWDLEATCIDEMGNLLTHLEESRARWTVVAGTFQFTNNTDLDRFNAIFAKINAAVARQTEIREKSMNSAKEKLRGL
jgi:hypothetical protein